MKPLKHTNLERVSAYLKPDTQEIVDSFVASTKKSASNAIATIISQHKTFAANFPGIIYQASLVDNTQEDNVLGYKLYQIYLPQTLCQYVSQLAQAKGCQESRIINQIIREWFVAVSKLQNESWQLWCFN